MIDSEYILTVTNQTVARAAYGLESQQSFSDVFAATNTKIVTVVQTLTVPNNDEVILLKVSPPITFDALTQPARISDCSGPSQAVVGEELAYFGLGVSKQPSDLSTTMRVACAPIESGHSKCDQVAQALDLQTPLCLEAKPCISDQGGGIMTLENGNFYVVGLLLRTEAPSSCTGELLFFFHFVSIFKLFKSNQPPPSQRNTANVPIAQPSICRSADEINSIINGS